MRAELAALVARTRDALAARLDGRGVLHDPVDGGPTPPDHYASTFTALALWPDERWRQLVQRFTEHEPRGHLPFQRLALLLLRERHGADALLERALGLCRARRDYPSNNWVLLDLACDVLEEPARAGAYDEQLARWLTSAGGFVDFPARPEPGRICTPTAYHAKAVLTLALVQRAAPTQERAERLSRALSWLLAFDDGAGRLAGFGRSPLSLYGEACLLTVLALAQGGESLVRAHVERLEESRRADGLLELTPGSGWDPYMHLSVYNAWLAGLLAWALQVKEKGAGIPSPLSGDAEAGLLVACGRRLQLWLSLEGQPVQGSTPGVADLRWAGMQPFHGLLDGKPALPPAVRVPCADIVEQPWLSGWVPLVSHGEQLYALARWSPVHWTLAENRLVVVGTAEPSRLDGPRGWLEQQVDELVLHGARRRRAALDPPRLAGLRAQRAILADLDRGLLGVVTLLRGARTEAQVLSPGGHALVAGAWPAPDGGSLPSALAGARGACAPACAWPERDTLWVTRLGEGTSDWRFDLVPEGLEGPWGRIALEG